MGRLSWYATEKKAWNIATEKLGQFAVATGHTCTGTLANIKWYDAKHWLFWGLESVGPLDCYFSSSDVADQRSGWDLDGDEWMKAAHKTSLNKSFFMQDHLPASWYHACYLILHVCSIDIEPALDAGHDRNIRFPHFLDLCDVLQWHRWFVPQSILL